MDRGGGAHDRRFARRVDEQIRLLVPLAVVWIAGSMAIIAIGRQRPELAGELLLDPSYFAGVHWYTGLVSNLGVMAWTIAAVAAGFGWWACRAARRTAAARMFRGGALLTTFLAFDDLLQLHIDLAGRVTSMGKPLVELGIASTAVVWAARNRAEILRTRAVVLGAAIGALATSILVDTTLDPSPADWALLWEDGAKFLGILGWATFFTLTTLDVITSIARDRGAPERGSAEDLDPVAARVPGEGTSGESGRRRDLVPLGPELQG